MWTLRRACAVFACLAALAGCYAAVPSENRPAGALRGVNRSAAALPAEILYVAGGSGPTHKPFLEVFDGGDKSVSPSPIYTIAPNHGGSFGSFAVDSHNTLYVANELPNGTIVQSFPAGATTPSMSCTVAYVTQRITVHNGTLYMPAPGYKINEYALPLSGPNCPRPARVLVDRYALLRGSTIGLIGVAVDANDNVYDSWQTAREGAGRINRFRAGSPNAQLYAIGGKTFTGFDLTTDSHGHLITNVDDYGSSNFNDIAVYPKSLSKPLLSYPMYDGQYLGVALANNETELFMAKDNPSTQVDVYSYDADTGTVGKIIRSFTNVWYYAQPIAVFSRN
jgi:hypothetical protein